MLTLFPELLTFGILASFILRLVVGFYFLNEGFTNLGTERRKACSTLLKLEWGFLGSISVWMFGILEVFVGLSLVFGLFTQVGAIIALIIALKLFVIRERYPMIAQESNMFYVLLIAISLSLLFSGAGAFAIDLPL